MHNASQREFWNGETGKNWVTHDTLMETMLQPLGEVVIDTLAPIAGERVLDIGCGCGHTSLSLAHRVGAEGAITGIDISAPMLSVARTLAENRAEPSATIEFVEADAQTHDIQPDSFDVVFSRFGVMFFEDPVAAFSNIRNALRPLGVLLLAASSRKPLHDVAGDGRARAVASATGDAAENSRTIRF